jgi:heme-degrading monooxygenase HmoA
MQVVLIDQFIVPDDSKSELIDKARWSAGFLKTLPGYVDGFIYEKLGGDSTCNILTTAVWESEAAFENAKIAAAEEFQKVGFNPQEIMMNLKVKFERAVYRRSPY